MLEDRYILARRLLLTRLNVLDMCVFALRNGMRSKGINQLRTDFIYTAQVFLPEYGAHFLCLS